MESLEKLRIENNKILYSTNVIHDLSRLIHGITAGKHLDQIEIDFLNARDQFNKLTELFRPHDTN